MVRRVRHPAPQLQQQRDALLADYERRCADRPWAWQRFYGRYIEPLQAGAPVVLQGWQLAQHVPPSVVPPGDGMYRFYRVESDGRVVEVVARCDPNDPSTTVGYDEVA